MDTPPALPPGSCCLPLAEVAPFAPWRDTLFPPLTAGLVLKRIGQGLLGLTIWVAIGVGIALPLRQSGLGAGLAVTVGALTPIGVVVVLNVLGVFSRPRHFGPRQEKTWRRWLDHPTAHQLGLAVAPPLSVVEDSDGLCFTVAPAWAAQGTSKCLADLGHWCHLVNHILGSYGGLADLRARVVDSDGRCLARTGATGAATLIFYGPESAHSPEIE